jgi:hypothetical protein
MVQHVMLIVLTVQSAMTTMSITNIPYTMNVIIARNATGRSVPSIIATTQTVSINPVTKTFA